MEDDCDSDDSHVFGSGSIGSGVEDQSKPQKSRKPRHRSKKKTGLTKSEVMILSGVSSSMDSLP
jgi:hypothetical protein